MENLVSYFRELNFASMILRITLAMLVGGVIGFDREKKQQPAGFRTYMLVAVGAAMTIILGQYLDLMLNGSWAGVVGDSIRKTDVVRYGAIVISGIGFLGTGTILVTSKSEVKGLTTASGLWASACMGLAVGAGFYECCLIGFLLILICIKLLPYIENAVLAKARNMNIYIEMDSFENLGNVVNHMKSEGICLYDVEINRERDDRGSHLNGLFSVRLPEKQQHTELLARLSTLEGIIVIDEV